jgi:hypothetical protein
MTIRRYRNLRVKRVLLEKSLQTLDGGGPPTVLLYLKGNPTTVKLEKDFTRDVREISHYGTGDLNVRIRSVEDLDASNALIQRSYEAS